MIEDFRVDALEFPSPKEGVVEVLKEGLEVDVIFHRNSGPGGCGDLGLRPIAGKAFATNFFEGKQFGRLVGGKAFALLLLLLGDLFNIGGSAISVFSEQVVADLGDEGSVAHSDDGLVVVGGNFDRGMGLAGGGAADEERLGEAALLHLGGVGDHLVERGRDETGEADDVGAPCFGFFEDGVAIDHDSKVFNFVVVTGEDDGNDVFADVVHVSFDGGDEELAGGGAGGAFFFGLHERLQVGHGLFHYAGAFDHLWEEHLAGTK